MPVSWPKVLHSRKVPAAPATTAMVMASAIPMVPLTKGLSLVRAIRLSCSTSITSLKAGEEPVTNNPPKPNTSSSTTLNAPVGTPTP